MSAARETGPWVFSALVSAGVHVAAVAVIVAALPPLETPAAPTEFVLDLLEAPVQVEVEAVTANAVTPAVAAATAPAAASAQAIAPDSLQPTRVEALVASTPQTQTLSAAPAAGATAATVAIAGQAAISGAEAQAGSLQPAAVAPLPVTTTAASAGATGTSTRVETTSALAPMGATASAEAQTGRPVAGTTVPTDSAASPLAVATAAAAADATGTSIIVEIASALTPMGASARTGAQPGSPIAGIAVSTESSANPVAAEGTVTAAITTDMAEVTTASVTTAQSTALEPGAQAQAPKPAAAVAAPIPTGSVGNPANAGTHAVSGSGSIAPAAPATVAVTAALSASGVTLAPTTPQIDAVAGLDALDDYLAGYDGGDCFAVLPERPVDGMVALTAFAGSSAAAGAFIEAMARDFGAAVPVEARAVSAGQCGALSFVRSSTLYPGFDLVLALDADAIAVGAPLSGEVLQMTGSWLTLVVIDDEGRVSNLDAYVQPEGAAIRFEAPVVPTGGAAGKTQLLLAVATTESLAANAQDGEPAEAFLSALEAELNERGIAAELAVSAFTVR